MFATETREDSFKLMVGHGLWSSWSNYPFSLIAAVK
jgi:hypothetical protein